MFVTSQDSIESLFQYRFECIFCGYIEEEEAMSVSESKGNGPIMLEYASEEEFEVALEKYSYKIQTRTIKEIRRALKDGSDYIVVAWLNTRENVLGVIESEYLDHVENARAYFEEIEDYEKCTECVQIENQIKKL